ncbi:type VI secretion system baseplate protein IglJ, partial [Brucella sp. 09RB8918]|uniref:type VI secretion system baseplate protein IglJ n=1 Tax=Brucella sp. 09RB8918 TaxID=1844048 RepID=UPI0013FE8210
MVVLNDQNINNLRKIINKISINNLISILFHHGIKAEDIIVIPKLLTAASGSTILDVYFKNNKFCIEVNIFKMGNFSILEDKYLEYSDDDKPNSLQALLNGIKILSSRYILDNERLLHFTEKSFHISTYRPTIDTIINHLYQELKEDYNVIIN